MKLKFTILIIVLGINLPLLAQISSDTSMSSMLNMSIEELMNIPITAGASKASSIRESPGIMTVITADEIAKMGARDIMDVIQLVPGFEFGADLSNYVGVGLRGLWGSEGKVSVIIDGHVMNDLLYGNFGFGNHIPINQIHKIEIIRGPGSAIYGGTSQLGVILITTKAGELNGIEVSTIDGNMKGANGLIQRNNHMIQVGIKKKNYGIYGNAFIGGSLRSVYDYKNYPTGEYVPFGNQSDLKNVGLMLSGYYKNLKISFLYDKYSNRGSSYYGTAYPDSPPLVTNYYTSSTLVQYSKNIGKYFVFKPQLSLKNSAPWSLYDTVSEVKIYDKAVFRTSPQIDLVFDNNHGINVLLGSQFYTDNLYINKNRYVNNAPDSIYNQYSSNVLLYKNLSVYTQANYIGNFGSVTIGGRYEKHSLGFDAFVPRIAYTKALKNVHIKLLASQSYRTPLAMNFTSTDIKAEKATFFEMETGFKLGKSFFTTLNIYDITIQNLLVYDNVNYFYFNSNKNTGTRGFEIESKYIHKGFTAMVNYSYYNASATPHVPTFNVDPLALTNSDSTKNYQNYLLGFTPHKISYNLAYKFKEKYTISFSGNYFGSKFSYDHYEASSDSTGKDVIVKLAPVLMSNLFVSADNFMIKGFSLGLGVYNLFDEKYIYAFTYNGNHSYLPSGSREIVLKLCYKY